MAINLFIINNELTKKYDIDVKDRSAKFAIAHKGLVIDKIHLKRNLFENSEKLIEIDPEELIMIPLKAENGVNVVILKIKDIGFKLQRFSSGVMEQTILSNKSAFSGELRSFREMYNFVSL